MINPVRGKLSPQGFNRAAKLTIGTLVAATILGAVTKRHTIAESLASIENPARTFSTDISNYNNFFIQDFRSLQSSCRANEKDLKTVLGINSFENLDTSNSNFYKIKSLEEHSFQLSDNPYFNFLHTSDEALKVLQQPIKVPSETMEYLVATATLLEKLNKLTDIQIQKLKLKGIIPANENDGRSFLINSLKTSDPSIISLKNPAISNRIREVGGKARTQILLLNKTLGRNII